MDLAIFAFEGNRSWLVEDKAIKNLFAEYITNNLRGLKTVGIVDKDESDGLTTIAEPC